MTDFPEIAESEAGPELRPLYEDIRAVTGNAMVNLVYRHIATIPDALPWTWLTVKSMIAQGKIEEPARALPVESFGRTLPVTAFETLGLAEADTLTAMRVVAGYNRANALNIVMLSALRRIVDEVGDGPAIDPAAPLAAVAQRPRSAQGSTDRLPPIVPMAAIPSDVAELVRRLSAVGNVTDADASIVPSLYRHLAHWPNFLALCLAVLEPLADAGGIETGRRKAIEAADTVARPFAGDMLERGVAPIPAHVRTELRGALDVFVERVIPKMLPIGHTLVALTPQPWRAVSGPDRA